MIFQCKKCKNVFKSPCEKGFCPECEELSIQKLAQIMEKELNKEKIKSNQAPEADTK